MSLLSWARLGSLILLAACTSRDTTEPGPSGSGGGLDLVTTTAGTQPDSDGYTIMVDGFPHGTIGPNDSVTVPGVEAGSHTVELAGIGFNCATLGEFTRSVSVAADANASVDYTVSCDAASRSRIAFVRGYSDGNILIMNADGSDVTSLSDSLGAVYPRSFRAPVSWSGDGSRVAFTRADGALYATTADGRGVIQLAPAGTSPIWSRDGQKVAFLVDETAAHQDTCCRDNVFVAQGDGSGVTRVTDLRELFHYDFSANGETVAYEQEVTSHLYVIKADGTGVQPISPPGICCPQFPSLSPDGTKVTYFAYPDTQQDGVPGYEIYVSPVDGSGPAIDVSQNPGDDWSPVWAPDGSRIAFISSAPGAFFNPGSLHVVNADGTGQINLTPVDNVWQPAWSPDGTRIAYTGSQSGESHIYVANADGSGRTDVTPNGDGRLPTWTGR
jgi:Tol biopolymer transport system component